MKYGKNIFDISKIIEHEHWPLLNTNISKANRIGAILLYFDRGGAAGQGVERSEGGVSKSQWCLFSAY